MAKETIKVVQIDTNPATKSLKDLRNELKGFKDQMANLEEGSDAFLEIANKAGEVKHQIDEINESIKGASADFGDMIGNVTNVAAGITGAFQAVAGGLQAMGVESKAIDETIKRMQGLMAVTQGLSAIDDGIKSFDKLTKSLGKAGETLNGLVKGLGKLAAPVAIITALGVAFVKLKERIDGTSTALKNRETAQKNFNTELERELLIRQKAGYTEEENIQFQIAQLELRNQALTESNEKLQEENDLVSQNAQAAQSAAGAFGGFVAAHAAYDGVAQSANINVGANTKLMQENTKEINDNAEAIKKLKDELDIIDKAREVAKNRVTHSKQDSSGSSGSTVGDVVNSAYDTFRENQDEREKQYRLYLKDLEIELLNFKKAEQDVINKYQVDIYPIGDSGFSTIFWSNKSKTDAKGDYEQGIKDLQKVLGIKNQILTVENEITQQIKKEIINAENELKNHSADSKEYADLRTLLQGLNTDLLQQLAHVNALEQEYAEMSESITKITKITEWDGLIKWSEGVNEQFNILNHTLQLFSESSLGLSDMWTTAIMDMQTAFNGLVKTIITGGDDAWKGYAQAASVGLQAVGTMLNAASEEVDTNTKEGFEQQKKLQISATVMNMLSGIMAAWTSSMALPAPASFILGGINTVATAALGAAQIAKIKNTKFGDSGSSGSVSSGAVNSMIIPPVQYTNAVQGASTEGAIKDTKVYVTETDIKDTMNKVDVQESENTY